MRTEDDLRATFDHLADTAPSADEILATLRTDRPVRRSRTPLVLGAVLATTVVAIGAPLAVSHLKDHAVTDSAGEVGGGPAWRPWLSITVPPELTLNPRTYTKDRQVYQIYKPLGPWSKSCLLTVHRNGDFDPRSIPADSPVVEVNGIKGRVITSPARKPPAPHDSLSRWNAVDAMKTIAWQPDKGMWALITCESQLEESARGLPNLTSPYKSDLALASRIARGTSTGGQRLASPYQVGYLPAGITPRTLRYLSPTGAVAGAGHTFTMTLSDGKASTGYQEPTRAKSMAGPGWWPQPGDDLRISYETSKFWNTLSDNPGTEPDLRINGMDAWYINDTTTKVGGAKGKGNGIRIEYRGRAVVVESFGAGVSLAEVRKVAEQLQIAPSTTDLTTWFDAATAIPAPN
ncbi:hypothetical protein [Kribbella sp. NPDC023855]|uniref:hypothetical protein n=1 Tax=Kribbella sp. NPDC023855 TaxID=3154698 RepID=UPI00340F6622